MCSVKVSQVARTMVLDAERWHAERTAGKGAGAGTEPAVRVYEMKDILHFS